MAYLYVPAPSPTFARVPAPGKREPESHVTLVYLGKQELTVEQAFDIVRAIDPVVRACPKLTLRTRRVFSFPANPEDGFPIVMSVEGAELPHLRQEICRALDRASVPYDRKFPVYRPHVTLAYAEQAVEQHDLEEPIVWTAEAVELSTGTKDSEPLIVRFALPLEWRISTLVGQARLLLQQRA